MAEEGAVLPGALEPRAFFGRVGELQRLRRDARSVARGRGRSRVICARAGSGKTALLHQLHGSLFRQGEVLPVYYTVPERHDRERLAADFVQQVAVHALAFKTRDPSLFLRPPQAPALAGRLLSAYGAGGAVLAEALAPPGPEAFGGSPLSRAALLPHRFATAAGVPLLCMLDDADNLRHDDSSGAWPALAASSAVAPVLLAVEDESDLTRLLGSGAAAVATLDRLGPLSAEALRQLARHLARTAGLELDESAAAALERESAGSPFYLAAIIRALAERAGSDAGDVACAAASAVCDGELARYWIDRLAGALPVRGVRATAVEILAFCIRDDRECPDTGRLASMMLKPEGEVETALAGLCRAGVLRVDCSRIVVDKDRVFRDAVLALYRREFGGETRSVVTAGCAAGKIRGAREATRRLRREGFREALAALLLTWRGQQVPAALFDTGAFLRRQTAAAPGSGEEPLVTLPHVVSVASGRIGSAASLAGLEADALAWGLRGEGGGADADVAWVACRLAGGRGGSGQVTGFDRRVSALQAAGDLPASRLVRWAILDAPLDAEGEGAAAGLRVMTSTRRQLTVLAALLGVAPPPEEPPEGDTPPTLEMEMIIPRAADTELVAARALEQLAENLELGPEETGRLKTAVVEACINAFEHSGDRDGRVRLWFAVAGGRLLIRIENRGRTLEALPAMAVAGDAPRRRGWGLTLIRQLVDEVTIEPREDGVSLLMVKNIGTPARG